MGNITEVTLGNGETIQLKKDFLGYRVIEKPTKWYHYILGSKRNAFMLLILAIIGMGLYFGIKELIGSYKVIAMNPCQFCKEGIGGTIVNLSKLG